MTDSLRGAPGAGEVLERIGDAVAVVDSQGALRRANGWFEALYGIDGTVVLAQLDLRSEHVDDAGEDPLCALVTEDSRERLELEPGRQIVASFKATATRATPRQRN